MSFTFFPATSHCKQRNVLAPWRKRKLISRLPATGVGYTSRGDAASRNSLSLTSSAVSLTFASGRYPAAVCSSAGSASEAEDLQKLRSRNPRRSHLRTQAHQSELRTLNGGSQPNKWTPAIWTWCANRGLNINANSLARSRYISAGVYLIAASCLILRYSWVLRSDCLVPTCVQVAKSPRKQWVAAPGVDNHSAFIFNMIHGCNFATRWCKYEL